MIWRTLRAVSAAGELMLLPRAPAHEGNEAEIFIIVILGGKFVILGEETIFWHFREATFYRGGKCLSI